MVRIYTRQLFLSRNRIPSRPSSSLRSKTNVLSSSSICSSNLRFLQKFQNTRQRFQVQAHLITSGLLQHTIFASDVLKHSLDSGDVDYAVLILSSLSSANTFYINAVIKAFSMSSNPQQALVFYFEMLRYGFEANSFTFVPLVGSCAKVGCVRMGKMCHGQAVKNGVDYDLPVQNSLIYMYGCCEAVECALKLFDEMPVKDQVSWNSMVHVYASVGELDVAHKVFYAMPYKNVVSWNVMISGYVKGGNPGCGLQLFRRMIKKGLRGNEKTIGSVLTACSQSARLNEGRSVHGFMVRLLLKSSIILDTSLIDMYSRGKRVEVARRVFDRMSNRNLVCWNAMILGHCIYGCPNDGLSLFGKMVKQTHADGGTILVRENMEQAVNNDWLNPDEITFIGLLCACARAGLLTEGRNYLSQMGDIYGIQPTFAHLWCMANLYAGLGHLQEADKVLSNLPEDGDGISPESLVLAKLLAACRFQQDVSWGEQVAKSLIEKEPQNLSHYRLLLNVYAVAGLWENVANTKELMKKIRVGKLPGCSLLDLKEIVHCVKNGK